VGAAVEGQIQKLLLIACPHAFGEVGSEDFFSRPKFLTFSIPLPLPSKETQSLTLTGKVQITNKRFIHRPPIDGRLA
jgi:hypothetical protein